MQRLRLFIEEFRAEPEPEEESRPLTQSEFMSEMAIFSLFYFDMFANSHKLPKKNNATQELRCKCPVQDNASTEACAICLEGPYRFARVLPCGHQFCSPCIERWMSQSRHCPLCKHELK